MFSQAIIASLVALVLSYTYDLFGFPNKIYTISDILQVHTELLCMYVPVAVPLAKVIDALISLLLTIPPDIITVADNTPDNSDLLNIDDENIIIATVQKF